MLCWEALFVWLRWDESTWRCVGWTIIFNDYFVRPQWFIIISIITKFSSNFQYFFLDILLYQQSISLYVIIMFHNKCKAHTFVFWILEIYLKRMLIESKFSGILYPFSSFLFILIFRINIQHKLSITFASWYVMFYLLLTLDVFTTICICGFSHYFHQYYFNRDDMQQNMLIFMLILIEGLLEWKMNMNPWIMIVVKFNIYQLLLLFSNSKLF